MKICNVDANKKYRLSFSLSEPCYLTVEVRHDDGHNTLINRKSAAFDARSYTFLFCPQKAGELHVFSIATPDYEDYIESINCEEVFDNA